MIARVLVLRRRAAALRASRALTTAAPPFPTAPKLPRPTEPAPDECCANDCRDCVWTDYAAALDEWRRTAGDEGGGAAGGGGDSARSEEAATAGVVATTQTKDNSS